VLEFETQRLDVLDTRLDHEPLGEQYLAVLRAFVNETVRENAFYRARFDRAKIDPATLTSFDEFQRIPLLGPGEVSALDELALVPERYASRMRDNLRALPPAERFAKKFCTSGSTGNPKISFYTVADWDDTLDTHLRLLQHVPEQAYHRLLNFFHPGHFGGKVFEDFPNRSGFHAECVHFANDRAKTLRQFYRGTQVLGGFTAIAIPPRTPAGTTSKGGAGITLEELLELDTENFIGRNIRLIVTSGAPRDLESQALLEQVWEVNELAKSPRTRFVDIYGFSEIAGPAAAECEYNDGAHFLPGMTYLEVLDEKSGKPVEHGQTGLVVATGLKRGSRYIRYQVGDEATFIAEPCRCGRATPRIKNVKRVIDQSRLIDGCAAGW